MELLESDENKVVEERHDHSLTVTQPVYNTENSAPTASEEGQGLLQTIIMIVGGIILVILLVLFARWLYHKVHHSSQITSTGTSQVSGPYTPPANQPAAPSQPTNNPSSNTSKPTNNSGLPNSGPGNVAAVFAGSTLAAAGLHYIIRVRRFNKTGY